MTPAPAAGTGSVVAETLLAPSPVDKGLRWVTSILLLIFPTATLFVNRGDSYVLGLLTLLGIWVWFRDGARRWLDRPSALLWLAFVLFFAVALLSYLLGTQTDAGFRFLGRYLRFLLIAPVYLALRRYPPTAKTVFIGLALGALFAGVIGGLHVYHAGAAIRVEATTGLSIIFGDLAATMTLCVVVWFSLLVASQRTWMAPLLVLCIVGGIAATLLSGARGAWIPLLLLPALLIWPLAGFLKPRYLFAIVLVLITVFTSFYLIPQTGTHDRIKLAYRSAKDYFMAQGAVTGESLRKFTGAHCVDQKAWLIEWAHFYYYQSNETPPQGLKIVEDPLIAGTHLCKGKYAVQLHNSSPAKWLGVAFPRVTSSHGGKQSSVLLVRGTGSFVLDDAEYYAIPFNFSYYERVVLQGDKWSGRRFAIAVAPGKTTWLVPLDNYYGEYSLAIADNSVGQRFEMWRVAWMIYLRHPILGTGFGAFQETVGELIQQGRIATFVRGYDHPHNDYLNALSSSGIVGLVFLLGILVLPIWHFSRRIRSGDRAVRAVSMAGLLTVMGFAIYALTDTIFLHSMMITWYVVYIALFYALLDARVGKLAKPEPPKH